MMYQVLAVGISRQCWMDVNSEIADSCGNRRCINPHVAASPCSNTLGPGDQNSLLVLDVPPVLYNGVRI